MIARFKLLYIPRSLYDRTLRERDQAIIVATQLSSDNVSQNQVITDQRNLIADLQGEISKLHSENTNLAKRNIALLDNFTKWASHWVSLQEKYQDVTKERDEIWEQLQKIKRMLPPPQTPYDGVMEKK